MSIRDLNDAQGTQTPWDLADWSDAGDAIILGAPGSLKTSRFDNADGQQIICHLRMNDPEDGSEIMRVQVDARRIIAAVNFTANLPLEMLEDMAMEPLSPPGSH